MSTKNYFTKLGRNLTRADADNCFSFFDIDRDGYLNKKELGALISDLICSSEGKTYLSTDEQISQIISLLCSAKDVRLGKEKFYTVWDTWICKVICPVSALLIVDVQNDFISGSLSLSNCPAKHNGADVVPVLNRLLSDVKFDMVVYTQDWHPENHCSFIDNLHLRKFHERSKKKNIADIHVLDVVVFDDKYQLDQIMWPRHCQQNSRGAELHPDLQVIDDGVRIKKGCDPDIDSYSAFWDNKKISQTLLAQMLQKKGVTDVFVCGIAYDVCVGATAEHSLEFGFRTSLIEDATRGVAEEGIADTRKKLLSYGACAINSKEVADMVSGKDRREELAVFALKNQKL